METRPKTAENSHNRDENVELRSIAPVSRTTGHALACSLPFRHSSLPFSSAKPLS